MQRIIVRSSDGTTSTSAYVVTGQNHLLQKRQFAFDGRRWWYQPNNRSKFILADSNIPQNVLELMAAKTGKTIQQLTEGLL